MTAESLDQNTAETIAVEAYIYLYPLVLMDVTREQMTNVVHAGDKTGRGPVDEFIHVRQYPAADFNDVVKPNFDTLYSVAWLDLSGEPRIVSVPDAGDNYFLLPMYDMWTEIFACPGTRTTGNGAADFAVCGPDWQGELPEGVERIDAPTPTIWMIGRTKASPETYEAVHRFQDGMRITPLGAWPESAGTVTGTHDPAISEVPPLRQVFAMDANTFFGRAAELMKSNPPHFNDHPIMERMARAGLVTGESFVLDELDPVAKAAFEKAPAAGAARITDYQKKLAIPKDGWMTMSEGLGAWGTNYMKRATAALIGLGVNLPEDAIYPLSYLDAGSAPYSGANEYKLRFEADALPPVDGFWSLTLYDDEGFQVANELDRFAIGDRDGLVAGDDGSIEVLIQATEPASGTSNWLPAPKGSFNLALRLYLPKAEVLHGEWSPPGVTRT